MTSTLVEAPPAAALTATLASPEIDECPAGGAHCWVKIIGERSVGIPDHIRCDECGAQPRDETDDTEQVWAADVARFASIDEAGW